jgi:2,3-bisphosphoglycerate-dependent phosphoglycerate mutase
MNLQTHVYLVRHAHSEYTPDELSRPLSEKGAADARKVAEALKREGIGRILSSPYKRAVQTVAGISREIKVEIELREGFRERLLSSEPVGDFPSAISKVWEDERFAFQGGESNQEAKIRGAKAVLEVLRCYEGERIAIGTHGNIMALIMNYFDNRYDFRFWQQLGMPDIYCLTFDGVKLKKVRRIALDVKA